MNLCRMWFVLVKTPTMLKLYLMPTLALRVQSQKFLSLFLKLLDVKWLKLFISCKFRCLICICTLSWPEPYNICCTLTKQLVNNQQDLSQDCRPIFRQNFPFETVRFWQMWCRNWELLFKQGTARSIKSGRKQGQLEAAEMCVQIYDIICIHHCSSSYRINFT